MMADGEIRIKVSVDGKEMDATISDLDKMQTSGKKAAGGIKDMATALGLVKVAGAAIHALSSSLDGAIKRFDTMERYPKVMESLGYGADASRQSIDKLSKGIEGLPTTLDSVVASTQRMTTITGKLGKSTDAVLALNNSFMANGASVSDAERGMIQYTQMLSKGTVDIMSWRTLQETMGVALRKTAEAMGYLGSNGVNQLYSALKSGKTTFAEFQDRLIGVATGTGEIAKIAHQNSAGIATSFINLKTAVTRNLADLVKVFDDMSKEITGKTIAENIDGMKDGINSSFHVMKGAVKKTIPIFKGFAEVAKATISVVKELSPVLLGVAVAYAGFKIISKANGLVSKSNALLSAARKSSEGLTGSVRLYTSAAVKKTIAESADVEATKAQIAMQAAQNGTLGLGTAAYGLLTGALTVHEAATIAATAATNALNAALSIIGSPIGIVVTAIGALAAGFGIVKSATDKASDSTIKLDGATKKLIETTEKDTKQSQENADARKKAIDDIDANTDAYNALADELDGLTSKEHKSASDKARIQAITESLNGSLEGLGIAYDKENDSLSMGNKQLNDRISAMQASTKAQEAQKNLVPITKELVQSEKTLNQYKAQRDKLEDSLSEKELRNAQSKFKTAQQQSDYERTQKKSLDEINTKIDEESKHYTHLKGESKAANDTIAESQAIADAAVSNGVMGQITSYANLTESQKAAVDSMKSKWQEYQEQATNMFDVLSDKQTISVDQMAANLEENQRVMGQWADNMATLASKGVDQGVLDKLRELGPKGAGYVAALVDATPAQLDRLNTAFKNGGTTATDSLKKTLDFKGSGIPESITSLVTQTQTSLREQMAGADFASITADVGPKLAEGISQNAEAVRSPSEQLGKNVSEGAASGIQSGSGLVKDSVSRLAESVQSGFASPLGIHSPSTVFIEFGNYIIAGLKNGIANNKESAISAMKEVATALPKTFDGLQDKFYQIGSYLMSGLANGINDNADTAVAAAQAVATKVKAATQDAYVVESPSRWMKDFIGKNLMYGLAEGLKKYAFYPVDAMGRAAESIKLPMMTAEMAIGDGFAGKSTYRPSATYHYETSDNSEVVRAINKLAKRPIVVSTKINSREVVRATAVPMNEEINNINKFNNMLKGVRI